ncbi:TPA: tyrosine-type recombinase/integrase [Pseudomonas aeruginosa]|uniref:Tyrosine-type recombinase/integrase n=1 Tax=Pseudomonas synxantha TaxID=47883 RepID=A0ABS0UCR8_9PSED|nr:MULTISPECIES: integrase arm-type DNA-binding domain-containing protein [Pseudomonas]MBI6563367.1 tyrosine-type recombinase/integrase [Pseudomonas synxantha]MBI6580670.1 tyrosine-type recombinase/integrase [Pseudomonas synxantha]MBI6642809.1 tyrosine-type recombinase/integrase [Pseudomonas synxantha]HCF1528809.1 tyrosine-type recombinase/integrase [Pseudomonas aeruginosa]
MALTDMMVRQAKATGKDYTLPDFDGLSLAVSANGGKSWHFRYTWLGRQKRMSLGTYPEIGLREARERRDNARGLVAKEINPQRRREKDRHLATQAEQNTFEAVYDKWFAFRAQSRLKKNGRNTTKEILPRIFKNDILPSLRKRSIHDITRADLLEIVGRIEKRGAPSVAEKVRTWFNQLFRYALVVVPGLEHNPASDLDVVAMQPPPVRHNPFLRMPELPEFLQLLRKYPGKLKTQLGVRLLLLTGVRTGELRLATPDQFHLDEGLWIIPPEVVKQLELKAQRENLRLEDIPPYIVPLPTQAIEIVRHMLDQFKPAQTYLFPGDKSLKNRLSENTLNKALHRLGYEGRLTGHGIRGTISTALNELGYPDKWVDGQLSHVDPNAVRRTYNHAKYVEQRRRMMQDWADRLDLFEQGQVDAASTVLAIQLEGYSVIAPDMEDQPSPSTARSAPTLVVSQSPQGAMALATAPVQRLSPVRLPKIEPAISNEQRERMILLDILEAPHNVSVADYGKLAGKSRRWITYEITAGNLLSISLGNRGQRVPDWQLDPLKRQLTQAVLKQTQRGVDTWHIYRALTRPYDALGGLSPIEAVTAENLPLAIDIACHAVHETTEQDEDRMLRLYALA